MASLPRGQSEAAYALGMRKSQVMTLRAAPAGRPDMLPTIISQLVVVLKDTALGFLILYPELLYQARYLGGQGQLGSPILPVAMVIAAIYIAMCLLLSSLANFLERRPGAAGKGAEPAAPESGADPELGVAPGAVQRRSEVLHQHRLDALPGGQLEAEHLGVEAQLGVQRAADVLRPPEAVLLAVEQQVGHRHPAVAQRVDDLLALRWAARSRPRCPAARSAAGRSARRGGSASGPR